MLEAWEKGKGPSLALAASRLCLITYWPRNHLTPPTFSPAGSPEHCPTPIHYSHLCPRWLQSPEIPRSPQLLPNKLFPRLPSLERQTPHPPPGWPCGVCLFPPISLHLCIWSLTQGLTPHTILPCAEPILQANDLQHMLHLLFFLLGA